jgi:hypothetical protein
MGKRKDQDAVFAARIRELPADLYPILLARAMDPFSEADTNPFRASGHAGDKYVYIRYCPDRDTRTPLGCPALVQRVVGQLLAQKTAHLDRPVYNPTMVLLHQKRETDKFVDNGTAVPSAPVDLPQAPSASLGDRAQKVQPADTVTDHLPRNAEQTVGISELSAAAELAAANLIMDVSPRGNTDPMTVSLEPSTNLAAPIQPGDLPHVFARGVAQLSDSYWKLPTVSTIATALMVMLGVLLVPNITTTPPGAVFAAQSLDLPQVVPSSSNAVNAIPIDARPSIGPQDDLPQPIKAAPLTSAVRGKLAGLFAAIHSTFSHEKVVEQGDGVVCVSIQTDEAHSCGKLLEQYLFQSSYSTNAQEDEIRGLIRTKVAQVSMRNGAVLLAIEDVAAYRHALVDPDDSSRHLSGMGTGTLWLEFKADHIEVTEVSP